MTECYHIIHSELFNTELQTSGTYYTAVTHVGEHATQHKSLFAHSLKISSPTVFS
jgi:hypothetical protein